ncbi:trypsin-like peptidase domain-containing protein [Phragmitibacter flavus]|uniref:Trypsin-like peptidase domain-containing protein n=1 Tax=Phragmitibacter flavus TaxID=2576071 RepID=A0A5R8KJL1_9BACT|nr:serine protease [Phragmitibacter flavus]TLD72506.1 trypsin-like peptidase domain-containing protein [Phragmitibacter flavus]
MSNFSKRWALAPKAFPLVWALLFFSLLQSNLHALDATGVFKKVKSSTVLVETALGHGSGVVLSAQGLIVTNLHVVSPDIDLRIHADVSRHGKIVATEITEVVVLKVHPQYDLAILQAKAPQGASFIPATMAPRDQAVSSGARCYVIGNPAGPGGKVLDLSITEGLVSATSREVEKLDYLQISAQINPGNSGGPVCNDQGQVIGIATFKAIRLEGVGFAIPSRNLVMQDFVDQAKRPVKEALAGHDSELPGIDGASPIISADTMREVEQQADKHFRPQSTPVPEEGVIVPMPAAVDEMLVANAGWQLVLRFASINSIGVFNLANQKFDGFIECADPDALIATGGRMLVVYLPSSHQLEVYDLETLEKTVEKPVQLGQGMKALQMGALNPSHLLALYATPPGRGMLDSSLQPAIITLPDLDVSELEFKSRQLGKNDFPHAPASQKRFVGCMDDSGTQVALSNDSNSTWLFRLLVEGEDRGVYVSHRPMNNYQGSSTQPYLLDEGRMLLASKNLVALHLLGDSLDLAGRPTLRPDAVLAPVWGFKAIVNFTRAFTSPAVPEIEILSIPHLKNLNKRTVPETWQETLKQVSSWGAGDVTIMASAKADLLACWTAGDKRLLLAPLNLINHNAPGSFAEVGEKFERTLRFPEGSSAALASGPEQMTIDAAKKILQWQVPSGLERQQTVTALLLITHPDGHTEYQLEHIPVK